MSRDKERREMGPEFSLTKKPSGDQLKPRPTISGFQNLNKIRQQMDFLFLRNVDQGIYSL